MKYLKLFEIHTWQSMAINRYRQKKKKIYKKYIVDDARKEEENIYVWEVVKYGEISKLGEYFQSFKHKGEYQEFDHGTFLSLPDEITGINNSYHLKKDYVINDRDMMGYSSFFFADEEGTEISALQNFYISIYSLVEEYNDSNSKSDKKRVSRDTYYKKGDLKKYSAIALFDM